MARGRRPATTVLQNVFNVIQRADRQGLEIFAAALDQAFVFLPDDASSRDAGAGKPEANVPRLRASPDGRPEG